MDKAQIVCLVNAGLYLLGAGSSARENNGVVAFMCLGTAALCVWAAL